MLMPKDVEKALMINPLIIPKQSALFLPLLSLFLFHKEEGIVIVLSLNIVPCILYHIQTIQCPQKINNKE